MLNKGGIVRYKFRAWDEKEKRMLQSVGFRDSDCGRVILPEMPMILIGGDRWKEQFCHGYPTLDIWNEKQQERFILLQFTGLLDKNGVEIYENDIIKVNADEKFIGTVLYRQEVCAFEIVRTDFRNPIFYSLSTPMYNFEIIGNIYENPELITKGEV